MLPMKGVSALLALNAFTASKEALRQVEETRRIRARCCRKALGAFETPVGRQ